MIKQEIVVARLIAASAVNTIFETKLPKFSRLSPHRNWSGRLEAWPND
jgi:hypothetical protein